MRGLVHFEPFLPVPLVWRPPSAELPPRPSGWGVLAEGVELETLSARREKDGSIEGAAALTGRWREERLFVTEQAPLWAESTPEVTEWSKPPCTAPPGG